MQRHLSPLLHENSAIVAAGVVASDGTVEAEIKLLDCATDAMVKDLTRIAQSAETYATGIDEIIPPASSRPYDARGTIWLWSQSSVTAIMPVLCRESYLIVIMERDRDFKTGIVTLDMMRAIEGICLSDD